VPCKNLDINTPIVYDKYLAGFVKMLKALEGEKNAVVW
jgi:hypothetical protein